MQRELGLTRRQLETHFLHLTRLGICKLEEDRTVEKLTSELHSLASRTSEVSSNELLQQLHRSTQFTPLPLNFRAITLTEIGVDFLRVCQGTPDEVLDSSEE